MLLKDPGRSWSRATQIPGGELKKIEKFKFPARNHERIRIYHYMTFSISNACWITIVKRQAGSNLSGLQGQALARFAIKTL